MNTYFIDVDIELRKTYAIKAKTFREAMDLAEIEACKEIDKDLAESDFEVTAIDADRDWDTIDKEEKEELA